jgi:ribosomal protein S18 acetylase RimI-like enzyme
MEILPFSREYISAAAALFVENFSRQCLLTPGLPADLLDRGRVEQMLTGAFGPVSGLVAVEDGRFLGYLGWFLVEHFRATNRKAAYVPEWGHACLSQGKTGTYPALYRAAGMRWSEAGCQTHAITVLACDKAAERAWYWNGFGLAVVDGIRPMRALKSARQPRLVIRQALPADAGAIAQLDADHAQHYTRSPIFMAPRAARTAAENLEFLSRPKNSLWLAEDGEQLAGFMRFEGYDFDSAAMLESDDGIMISGAYIRPAYRAQKLATALLDAALRDYQSRGFQYCGVNFESFNPEATAFWLRHFDPVCYSLMRIPEA